MAKDLEQWRRLLRKLGWRAVETDSLSADGTRRWQVTATRADETILASAPAQPEAWAAALKMARIVEHDDG